MAKFITVTEDTETAGRARINIDTIQHYVAEEITNRGNIYTRTRIFFDWDNSRPYKEQIDEIDELIDKANGSYVPIQENPFLD